MAPKTLPDQATLLQLLRYDPETGLFFWRERTIDMFGGLNPARSCATWNARYAGTAALCKPHKDGYRDGKINHKHYMAHRVAWKISHGTEPGPQIDHENGIRSDNRISNLKSCDQFYNQKNSKIRLDNPSGATGVFRRKNRWIARIKVNLKDIHIGCFASFSEAVAARRRVEELYGFHPNHGRRE